MRWKIFGSVVLSLVLSQSVSALSPPVPKEYSGYIPVTLTFEPEPSFSPIPSISDNQRVEPSPTIISLPTHAPVLYTGTWVHDLNVSWYGPNFYGNRTACGLKLTTTLIGVAHRTLPCGTLVEFKYTDKSGVTRSIVAPVVDRGPYVSGRIWDLTHGLCDYLNHCFTGTIWYRILKG